MFLRFVVGVDAESAWWLTGVITMAQALHDDGGLYQYESGWLEEVLAWLNEHLPCPPFKQKLRSGQWTADAGSWFRAEAGEPLDRMWDIVAILREHGVPVRVVTARQPGKVVYSDRFQVVAETPRWA